MAEVYTPGLISLWEQWKEEETHGQTLTGLAWSPKLYRERRKTNMLAILKLKKKRNLFLNILNESRKVA